MKLEEKEIFSRGERFTVVTLVGSQPGSYGYGV